MPSKEREGGFSTRASSDELGGLRVRAPGLWAWGLCWLMFASTVLNYMDRQAIALVGPRIMAQFALDYLGFGWVLAAFQLSYAFFQWPAGYLVDRWNVRRTYAGAVLWWSFAGIATAFAPTLGLLMTFRALLGMGESFNWPCALRVTSRVLPPSDRSLGNGIFNSGAAIGAQLYHHRPAPLGRTGRSARVLAPGRHKTSLDGSLAFWHHSRSTLQIFPFQGVRPVRGTRLVLNPTTGPVSAPS